MTPSMQKVLKAYTKLKFCYLKDVTYLPALNTVHLLSNHLHGLEHKKLSSCF